MKNPVERVAGFVDDLIHGRRPRRFNAAPEDVEALRVASELASARPGADLPDRDFIDRLGAQLRSAMTPAPERRVMSRRMILRSAGVAAAAGIAGAVIDRTIVSQPSGQQSTLTPVNGTWRPIADIRQVPAGQAVRFSSGSIEGVVVNEGGAITALSAVCTHQGCVLLLDAAARRLRCPCHPTDFALSGKVTSSYLPTPPPSLPKLQTRVRDGQIEVLVV
jgi:nitrite reductase/ring-hydroxylating ferredoxin subunit